MFRKTREEGLMNRAQEFKDALTPHLENAREQLADAREQAAPLLAEAREKLAPHFESAREQLSDAREQAAPYVAEARGKAAPLIAEARDKVRNEYLPLAQIALAEFKENAAPVTEEAKGRAFAAAAALKGEDPAPRKGRSKLKLAVLLAAVGAGAAAFKKARSGQDSNAAWQSSYAPSHAGPEATPAPDLPETDLTDTDLTDDKAGAAPDEVLADAAEAPHPVTTPDDPAVVIEIKE